MPIAEASRSPNTANRETGSPTQPSVATVASTAAVGTANTSTARRQPNSTDSSTAAPSHDRSLSQMTEPRVSWKSALSRAGRSMRRAHGSPFSTF